MQRGLNDFSDSAAGRFTSSRWAAGPHFTGVVQCGRVGPARLRDGVPKLYHAIIRIPTRHGFPYGCLGRSNSAPPPQHRVQQPQLQSMEVDSR